MTPRPIAALLLVVLALPAAGQGAPAAPPPAPSGQPPATPPPEPAEPTIWPPLAQRRPPDAARTPAHLRVAQREKVACGPEATRAVAVLGTVGRTGKLTLEEFDALRIFCAGEEAARHPVLVAMAVAVALEQLLPLDEATPTRREALLDALLAPTIPEPACLGPSTVAGVRFRVLAETCNDMLNRRVDVKAWAQSSSRTYLLMLHRTGEDVTEDCRRALHRELGDPAEMDASPLVPPSR